MAPKQTYTSQIAHWKLNHLKTKIEDKKGKKIELNENESEDEKNTRQIFQVCDEFMTRTNCEVQIIILEHAPKDTWKDIKNVKLVEAKIDYLQRRLR